MIEQENIDKLRVALIEACDKHLAEGGKIRGGAYVSQYGYCPLGCLSGGSNYFAKFNEILGLPTHDRQVWDFITAFDGNTPQWDSLLAELGRELRAKYITKGQ
jgi:hypothetical protein